LVMPLKAAGPGESEIRMRNKGRADCRRGFRGRLGLDELWRALRAIILGERMSWAWKDAFAFEVY